MLKYAARPPTGDALLIMNKGLDVVGVYGSKNKTNPIHAAFRLSIKPKMITVNGRILPAPRILYKTAKMETSPRDGSWNMSNLQFTVPMVINNWSYIEFNLPDIQEIRSEEEFRQDLRVFQETLRECGISAGRPVYSPTHHINLFADKQGNMNEDKNDQVIRAYFKEIAETTAARILLVILPTKHAGTYARIKYWADVIYGIHTVCVNGNYRKFYNNQGRSQQQYCVNVALKFNLKAGGVNQSLPANNMGLLQDDKTMVVGIDVTHPSPGSLDETPSIAGVVASIDKRYAQWPASIRPQTSKQEMMDSLDQMVTERLQLWRKNNGGKLPEKIIVYRDGVSEGQYETVLQIELPGFQTACEKLYGKLPRPKISIIIVGKRHHTRFYPTSTNDGDRNGNTKNGTVVDRGVTMENGWDFFLQAHHCLKGTAKPAHYVVIRDEIGLGADVLEQMVSHPLYLSDTEC